MSLSAKWVGEALYPICDNRLEVGLAPADFILKNLISFANTAFVAWVDGRAGHQIRSALSSRLLRTGYSFFAAVEPGRLINIITTESWRASEAIRAFFSGAASVGSLFIFGALLILVNWRLTLAVILGTFLIRLVHRWLSVKLGALSRQMSETNARLASRMLFAVLAMRLIRIYGQEAREQARFDDASEDMRRAMFRVDCQSAIMLPLQEVLQSTLFVALLLGTSLLDIGITAPALVAFLVILQRMQPHLRTLESARVTLAAAQGPVGQVEWLLDPTDKPALEGGTLPFPGLQRQIAFENVEFHYDPGRRGPPTLRRADFRIMAGRATAIIGTSGSGKSKTINLICRLYEPTSGTILIDGVPLADIDPWAWRCRIGLAGQDIELIEGTIAENIAYGLLDAGGDAIREAARLADADEFICSLPDGYATDVGSRGLNLSGGQRQRIGLARALARRPEILILDEATSAIDGPSEARIMNSIEEADWPMTRLIVSHRASTLSYCDDGLVVEAGTVTEGGKLRSLSAYRDMLASASA